MQTKTQATEGKDPQQTTGESSLDDATCSPILIQFESRDSLLEMLCHRQFGAFPVYDDDPEIGLSDDAKKAVSCSSWLPITDAPNSLAQIIVTDGSSAWVDQKLGVQGDETPGEYYFNGHEDWEDVTHWIPLPSLPNAKTDPLHGRGENSTGETR